MRLPALAVFAALLPLPLVAQATEDVVSIEVDGQDMVGTLALPEGNPAPVVLLLHGFTGARDELAIPSADNEGVFARTARLLADAGYASLRIDFRGSGESVADLSFTDTTFSTQVEDAIAALDWLAVEPRVNGEDIYLVGWSQGGLVAAAAAGRSGQPDATALWNAVADPMTVYTGILGTDVIAQGLTADLDEPVAFDLPWAEGLSLNGAFFKDVSTFKPDAEIAAYSGPLFVATGTTDTTVLPGSADLFLEAHDGPSQHWTAEMDHVFDVFTGTEDLDRMIGMTVAFFEAHDD